MNLRGKMKKLQTAIIGTGLVIKINSNQFFSDDQKRVITSYQITTPVTQWSDLKQEWGKRDYEIVKTCSMPEIIMCLVDIYKEVRTWN